VPQILKKGRVDVAFFGVLRVAFVAFQAGANFGVEVLK